MAASSADVDAVVSQTHATKSGDDFLPPEQAFRFSASADGAERVRLNWVDRPRLLPLPRAHQGQQRCGDAQLGAPQFPPGQVKNDEYFGKQVVYHNELVVTVPVTRSGGGAIDLPLTRHLSGLRRGRPVLSARDADRVGAAARDCRRRRSGPAPPRPPLAPRGATAAAGARTGTYVSEQDRLAALLRSGSLLAVLLQFFVGGLLLAFTPCVLPMVPILSGLIVGQGQSVTTARAFPLSLTYVLGMAVTYTVTGVAVRRRRQAGAGGVPAAVDHRAVRGAVRRDGAVDVRPVHRADARLHPDARRRSSATASAAAASAASPSWARCRR